MAVDEIVIAAATGRALAGFFEAGCLVRVELAAAPSDRRLGEIVLGRVRRSETGLDAAFVDLGDGVSGFLNRADAPPAQKRPGDGEALLVQIVREADAGKGPKLTGRVALPGRLLIYCPGGAGIRVSRRIGDTDERRRLVSVAAALPAGIGGWFVRRAAGGAEEMALAGDARDLVATWGRIEEMAARSKAPARLWRPPDPVLGAIAEEAGPALARIIADEPGVLAAIRAHLPNLGGAELRLVAGAEAAAAIAALEREMDAILAPDVSLPGGGVIRMSETPALVAIDVDVAAHAGRRGEERALAVNLEAAAAIASEIRRRDLSGHIVVDFVAMRGQPHRARIIESLRQAFAGDQLETHVAGYTRLGKVELTRRRVRPSLRSRLCAPCPACAGSGDVPAAETAARRLLRAAAHDPGSVGAIEAAPGVIAALRGDVAGELAAVEARLGRKLMIIEAPRNKSVEPAAGLEERQALRAESLP